MDLNWLSEIISIQKRILVIGSQYVKKKPILCISLKVFFPTQLLSQWSINIVVVAWLRFQQCLDPSPCCLWKVCLKREFLDIYFATYFGARNFGNTSAMGTSFFWKCSKFNLALKNEETNWENVFCFLDNCIQIGSFKFSLLRREYLSSEVNKLTKTLDITRRRVFQLNCFHSDQYIL